MLPHLDFDVAACIDYAPPGESGDRSAAIVGARTGEGMDAWLAGWRRGGEVIQAGQHTVSELKARIAALEAQLAACRGLMAWLPACPALPDPARLRLRLLGGCRGVGLRPAIWRLSQRWPLAGWVRNDGDGACIELEGARADVHAWLAALPAALPPLAQVDHAELSAQPCQGEPGLP